MNEAKLCPFTEALCDKERCGCFSEKNNCCAILAFANALDEISASIKHSEKRMGRKPKSDAEKENSDAE